MNPADDTPSTIIDVEAAVFLFLSVDPYSRGRSAMASFKVVCSKNPGPRFLVAVAFFVLVRERGRSEMFKYAHPAAYAKIVGSWMVLALLMLESRDVELSSSANIWRDAKGRTAWRAHA